MNMIEKVAKAIHDQYKICNDDKINGFSQWPELCAKAAIAAMREPTNNMANEYFKLRKEVGDINAIACFNVSVWETSIDAALKE